MGLKGLIWGLGGLIMGQRGAWGDGWTVGLTDVQTDGCLEIHPFVPQDIGSYGPLPKKGTNQSTDQRMDNAGYRVALHATENA